MKKIIYYILNYCTYAEEPLHLIINSLIEENVGTNLKEIKSGIIDLIKKNEIIVFIYDKKNEKYKKVNDFTEEKLEKYLNLNNKNNFKDYPHNYEEIYIKTTEIGILQLKEEDRPQ